MRESDQIKEPKSYVLHHYNDGRIVVKGSHWQPGYTAGHRETPAGAVQHRMDILREEIKKANAEISFLHKLKNDVKEKN